MTRYRRARYARGFAPCQPWPNSIQAKSHPRSSRDALSNFELLPITFDHATMVETYNVVPASRQERINETKTQNRSLLLSVGPLIRCILWTHKLRRGPKGARLDQFRIADFSLIKFRTVRHRLEAAS